MKGAAFAVCVFGLPFSPAYGAPEIPARPVMTAACVREVPCVRAESDDPGWSGPGAGVELCRVVGPGAKQEARDRAFATRVEARWDARFLYIRFWCLAPETPWAPHGDKRDALHSDGDVVEVFLDPVGDARQFVEVQVSPANGVFDKLYLLTGEPRVDAHGVLTDDVLRRDEWEFLGWNWDGLRSVTAEWKQGGAVVGWIADLALPAKPLLRRFNLKDYEAGMTLHAHFVRNACPLNKATPSQRDFLSFSWAPIPLGRPHRAPMEMGAIHLVKSSHK